MALYYRYVYLLGKVKQWKSSRRCNFLLREDFRKFNRYCAQFKFVWEHRIQSQEDLGAVKTKAEAARDTLTEQRKKLYRKKSAAKRNRDIEQEAAISAEIAALSMQIRACRREVMLCGWVAEDAERLRWQLSEVERQERHEHETERSKNEKVRKGGLTR